VARQRELQVILTTHSPYVLEEVPPEARVCIMQSPEGDREVVYGVSPEFAMTKMDFVQHSECDLYVEDHAARTMLGEILITANPDLVTRCQIIPFGAASVGRALGEMVKVERFPRASRVFLDGDQAPADGCTVLPGDDAPERVVFDALSTLGWNGIAGRCGREYAHVADACEKAMAVPDHHQWATQAASKLFLTTENLWQPMCAEWAKQCLATSEAQAIAQVVEDPLAGLSPPPAQALTVTAAVAVPADPPPANPSSTLAPSEPEQLF